MLEWVISSAVLIMLVIALRFVLKGKISLWLQYALWALVLLRLLVPVSFGQTGLSVMNVMPAAGSRIGDLYIDTLPQHSVEQSGAETYSGYETSSEEIIKDASTPAGEDIVYAPPKLQLAQPFRLIWLSGSAIIAFWLVAVNLRFSAELRRSRRELNISGCALPVYVAEHIDTPCLFGLFHPSIYITPAAAADAAVLRYAVQHELTHFRHGDHIWSFLRGVCLVLHWYDPLVWWAAVLSRNDAELACDEATIKRIGENERAEYGRTLIGMTCHKRPTVSLTATTMIGSKSSIRERILLMAKKPKTAIYTLVAVLLIAAVAVGCTFTGATDDKDKPWTWMQNLDAEKITSATAWYGGSAAGPTLVESDISELISILNSLEKNNFTENKQAAGATPQYGLAFEYGGASYFINEAVSPSGCLEMSYGGKQWWIDSEELDSFISSFAEGDRQALSVKIEVDSIIPPAVVDYATEYTQAQLDYYTDDLGYEITEAKITGLTPLNYAPAADIAFSLWLLEYRFLAADPEDVMLVGGMRMEGNCITEWGSTGQPYLLLNRIGDTVYERICVTNTLTMQETYSTPQMLEQYGDMYAAAAMELYSQYVSDRTWSEAELARWQAQVPLTGFSVQAEGSRDEIGQQWAEAFVSQYVDSASPDSPLYSVDAAVLSCSLTAESLLTVPKTLIYNMRFVCNAADADAFERWYVGWAGPLSDVNYPEYEGWMNFGWYVVLENAGDAEWICADAGTGGYGGWGYLNFDNDGEFAAYMKDVLADSGSGTAELVMRSLPLVDWSEFGTTWGAEGWSALYALVNAHCLTQGQVYGPEEMRMWADVYPDDQVYRNLYVMLATLNSDGAYTEGFVDILKKQQNYDPELFELCLQNLTQAQRDSIRMLVGAYL